MIYFIETNGMVKIGTSVNPRRRLHEITVACPTECKMIGTMEGGEDVERDLHVKFSPFLIRGEWFHFVNEIKHFVSENCVVPNGEDDSTSDDVCPSRTLRKLLGISQQQLADRMGVNIMTVWRWENKGIPSGRGVRKSLERELSIAVSRNLESAA